MIGKRKRELAVTHREQSTKIAPSNDAGSDVFRSYFEARFQPLPESIHSTAKSAEVDVEDGTDTSEQSEGSTWEGLSDEDLSTIVDVIDHGSQDVSADAPERSFEFKSFMVPLFGFSSTKNIPTDRINRLLGLLEKSRIQSDRSFHQTQKTMMVKP